MQLTRRTTLAAGAALAGAAALSACGGSSESSGGGQSDSKDLTIWLMRDSVPQTSVDWLVKQWADANGGAKLTVEIQDWTGIVTKLQTTLSSADQTPDLVEFGNSQVLTFTSAGALSDISDLQEELGGKDLLASLVDAGSFEGKLYAAPFYAGARLVYYRKSLLEKAGIAVPTTLDAFNEAVVALKNANPEGVANFSGIFLPAKDYGVSAAWIFTRGAKFAVEKGGKWEGDLTTPDGIAGLDDLKNLYANACTVSATATLEEARDPSAPYNRREAGMFIALNNQFPKVDPALAPDTGFFAFPGEEPGSVGKVFAGGSNIGIPAMSRKQEAAKELLKLVFQSGFMEPFASEGGWVPGNSSYAGPLEATELGAVEVKAVQNAVATPKSEGWGVVENNDVIRDAFTKLAQGASSEQIAQDTDAKVESLLNA